MTDEATQPIDASTRCCAVLGRPIGHSASPAMHNAALAHLGLNWRYLAFEVAPEDLEAVIRGAKAMRMIGLNLTVPHKLLAMPLVEVLDETASSWGAVNTIRFEGEDATGAWQPLIALPHPWSGPVRACGFNTDADAVVRALREDLGLEPRGASVLVVGVGGAGRVAALRLAAEGVSILYLVNRTVRKAGEILDEIRSRYPGVQVVLGFPNHRVDLLLNATSVGLHPGDELPFTTGDFSVANATAVYDMIYRPAQTALLKSARAAGCRVANGTGMLLYQGARALELWTGRSAPIEIMRHALEQHLYHV